VTDAAGKQWRPDSPNIPDRPTLIVLPVSLMDQFLAELHMYLVPGSFDIIPYLKKWNGRKDWWSTVYSSFSKQRPIYKLIPTTPSVRDYTLLSLSLSRPRAIK
jgi:hypothetical protein